MTQQNILNTLWILISFLLFVASCQSREFCLTYMKEVAILDLMLRISTCGRLQHATRKVTLGTRFFTRTRDILMSVWQCNCY